MSRLLASDSKYVEELKEEIQQLTSYVYLLKQRYKVLYERSPVLLRTISTQGIILDCNESYAKALGYTKNELIGTSIFDTVAEESLELMRQSFEAWKKIGFVRNREVLLKRKDGTVFPVLINANSVYDDNGNLIESNTVIHDLSEIYNDKKKHEEFEKILKKNINQLEMQRFEKEEFIQMITNELRSASLYIKNEAQTLLSEKTTSDEAKEHLKIIMLKSKSIAKMLADISDMQKIQNNALHLNKNICDLSKIIETTVSKIQADAVSHGSTITKDIEGNVFCMCDKNRIEQVLVQIITNAIDFSPKGSSRIKIKLTKVVGKYAKIVVKDNGIGIKSDNLNKIFKKFYQLDTSIIREHDGAGLGLAICKGIIEGHNGKIWAYSRGPGTGTEIHILLSLDDPDYNKIKKIK